ncbi:MAG: hypothetical protein KC656_09510 [Myxococcales bacterium]|nr:hypothetical protein [Myxococcales bacterium]MCB9668461.1 hypothetical protein [Alphaproteobacteria bacterium]MCB9690699.1 hypothetical protein [Alphaproteobacteria bacterium]
MIALLLALGCPKPAAPVLPSWETVPSLPSPTAGAYNRSLEAPPDAELARLVEGRRWDASLSGTAAGLALDLIRTDTDRLLTRWKVRESAWRAGWPYPIDDAKAWRALEDGAPPPQLLAWLEALGPDDDLGLVRARGSQGDLWVALKAHPRRDLGRIPRQLAQGGELVLPALPGARYAVADANGRLHAGALDAAVTLQAGSRGEWLVRIDDDQGRVALFPVYVGIVPPLLPLIEDVVPVRTAVDAIARTESLLATIRSAYGSTKPARDFMLDAGARSLLSGGGTTSDGVLGSLGLDPARTALWTCEGTTIEACLDGLIWTPEHRMALLDDASDVGLAADVGAEGVRLVGILSGTD